MDAAEQDVPVSKPKSTKLYLHIGVTWQCFLEPAAKGKEKEKEKKESGPRQGTLLGFKKARPQDKEPAGTSKDT